MGEETVSAISVLRRKGHKSFEEEDWERALAYYAELVRLAPSDHQARFRAARCLLRLGEQERAVTAYHAAAEGLLKKGFLLSAMAACKEALRIDPMGDQPKDTLRRIHARASVEMGATPVPPPLPPATLGGSDASIWEALTDLAGSDLVEKAMEVLSAPEETEASSDPNRPPLPLFAELEREAFVDLVQRMDLRTVHEGDVLIQQDQPGDAVYVICAGGANVVRRNDDGEDIVLARLPGGTLVGEMAFLTDAPRSASVVVDRTSEVFVLSRSDLEALAKDHPGVPAQLVAFCRRRLLANLVNSSPLFRGFDEAGKQDVLARFQSRVFREGERLITEAAEVEGLFVVLTGEVQVTTQDDDGDTVILAELKEGSVVGEIGLIRDVPATATVRALRKTAVVMLPADDFAELISDHSEVREYLLALTDERIQRTSIAMSSSTEEIGEGDLIVM